MNSLEILQIINKDDKAKEHFIGVYPRDKLPTINEYPVSFIINTQKSHESGEHWLAFYYNKNGNCEFFDSYGMHPNFYGLQNYLDKTSKTWTFNNKCFQSLSSTYCGQFCILFLFLRSRNYKLDFIKKIFFKNTIKNDKIIEKFFKK